MAKSVLAGLFLLFLCVSSFAVSSNEAVNFVVKDNSFLLEGENYRTPVATISDSKGKYWVIPVLSGDAVVSYFPVMENSKSLSTSRATNREVFRTADILRELSLEKERVSQSNSVEWVFTPTYTLLFFSLALSLNSETFQLNTISSTLNDQQADSVALGLKNSLSLMVERANSISNLIELAVKAEANFNSSPSVGKVNDLKDKFDAVFSELGELNESALSYRSSVNKLKEMISKSKQDPSTKTYLIALADPPAEFNSIGNYALDAAEISGGINSVYSKVNSGLDVLLDTFDTRVVRNNSFQLLFGVSSSVSSATKGKFSSVKEIMDFVLDEPNQQNWKARDSLSAAEADWKQAQKSFNEQNYESADFSGKKALNEAMSVYSQGFVEIAPSADIFSADTIFLLVTVLVVLLVLVFAYNNRGRISGFMKPGDGGKEVEIRGF